MHLYGRKDVSKNTVAAQGALVFHHQVYNVTKITLLPEGFTTF